MKYRELNILLIICISLITIVIGLYVFALISNKMLEKAIFNHLETTTQSRASHITHYLKTEKNIIGAAARNYFFEEELARGIGKENPLILQREIKYLFDVGPNYIELFLLNKNGEIIASTNSEFVGLNKEDKKYFKEPRNLRKSYLSDVYEIEEKNKYIVSAPVFKPNTEEFLGVLAAKISLEKLENITGDKTGLGETGEVYLINKDYLMITPSRFLKNTFLKQKIDTENSRACFEDSKGVYEYHDKRIYINYRGNFVLGAHSYISKEDWCLLIEISKKEALDVPRNKLMKNALIIIIVLFLISMIIGFTIRIKLKKFVSL